MSQRVVGIVCTLALVIGTITLCGYPRQTAWHIQVDNSSSNLINQGYQNMTIASEQLSLHEYYSAVSKNSLNSHGANQCNSTVNVDDDILNKDLHKFQPVGKADIFAITAFLENRDFTELKFVRVLAIVAQNVTDNILCAFNILRTEGGPEKRTVHGQIKLFPESVAPFCRWKTAFVYCPLPKPKFKAYTVSLQSDKCSDVTNILKVKSIKGKPTKTLGVCTDTMFNYGDQDIGSFMEFIELNLKLGVDRIFIYDVHNISINVEKVLKYYVSQGTVINIPWKVPIQSMYKEKIYSMDEKFKRNFVKRRKSRNLPNCVKKHAQHLAYLDCLYSNMAKFEYLAFLDRDEVIVPRVHETLPKMLKYLSTSDTKSVSFTNKEYHFCTNKSDILNGKSFQKFATQTRQIKARGSMKSIVKPKGILNMHIHKPILISPGTTLKVLPEEMATVHHYRNRHKCNDHTQTIQDLSLVKHQEYLLGRIETVAKELDILV